MSNTKPSMLLLLVAALLLCDNLFAQKKIKYGKLSKEEIELKQVSYDNEANAALLAARCIIDVRNGIVLKLVQ